MRVGNPLIDLFCQYLWGLMKGRPYVHWGHRQDRALAPLPSQGPPICYSPHRPLVLHQRPALCLWALLSHPSFFSGFSVSFLLSHILELPGLSPGLLPSPSGLPRLPLPLLISTSPFCSSKGAAFSCLGAFASAAHCQGLRSILY